MSSRNSLALPESAASLPLSASETRALFHVTGVADPGLVPRLVEPVAKLGYTPTRLYVSREDGDGSEVTVDLRIANVSQTDASRMERSLRSIVGVHQVIAVYEQV